MERHGRVEGKELLVGTQRYKTVVLPENFGFLENTQRILDEFRANGGVITTADEVEANNICSSPLITYTERQYNDYKIYFFINNNNIEVATGFTSGSKMIDVTTGETFPFSGKYTFAPYDCLILLDDGEPFAPEMQNPKCKAISLDGEWEITKCSDNILTIDTCDIYFNDELVEKDENAVDVLYMALDRKESLNVRLEYKFNVTHIPEEVFLVCENPHKFIIKVNEAELNRKDVGYFRDKSFRKIPLEGLLKTGENIVSAEIYFAPEQKLYDDIEKAFVFETEKNKLTFETEFESIYIVGNFSVKTDGNFAKLDKNAVRYNGMFTIDKAKKDYKSCKYRTTGISFLFRANYC